MVTMTAYRSVPAQTDDSPFFTSTGEHVRQGGAAVSRDLLCGACRKLHHRCQHPEYARKIHYGDWLYVREVGFLRVNDVMGEREHYWEKTKGGRRRRFLTIRNHIDVWVGSKAGEHAFYKKWGVKPVELYKVEVK